MASPMSRLSPAQIKRLTAVHGWSAAVLGLLLYAVVATGTVVVFADEIARWSSGGLRAALPLDQPIDRQVRQLAETVDPAFLEEIGIWDGTADDLHVVFHTHRENPRTGLPDDYGTAFLIDRATGEILNRYDGFVWEEASASEMSALRHFLVDLHVQLYLPEPWGLILTGMLGLMMMAAVISGVLMHRHLLKDLFVAERPGRRLVSARDRHVLSGSWSIPFAFVLAFTGSFFSFAGSVGFPLLAVIAFGGDQQAMSDTLFEQPRPENARPALLASLDYTIADSVKRAGGPAIFVSVERYGRADARVTVWHDPGDRDLLYVTNQFDGPTRAFLGRQAPVGTKPSAGGVLYGLMYPLHFGHFAGLASKAVWGALGVAMCFVILSGFRMWVQRREADRVWRSFGRVVVVTGYGLPFGMLASAWAFFLSQRTGDPFFWTPLGFVAGALLAVAIGLRVREPARLGPVFQQAIGLACLLLPVLRVGTGGMNWPDAIAYDQSDVLFVDLLLAIAGGVFLWHARRAVRGICVPSAAALPGPAE